MINRRQTLSRDGLNPSNPYRRSEMKNYVILTGTDYEGHQFFGSMSKKELAVAEIERLFADKYRADAYYVVEVEVDVPAKRDAGTLVYARRMTQDFDEEFEPVGEKYEEVLDAGTGEVLKYWN
jgi:hypothetical protein